MMILTYLISGVINFSIWIYLTRKENQTTLGDFVIALFLAISGWFGLILFLLIAIATAIQKINWNKKVF